MCVIKARTCRPESASGAASRLPTPALRLASNSQGVMSAHFERFRDELDEHNDRRERIIKASRDITAASKKAVFLLHRQMALPDADPNKAAAAARPKLAEIQRMLAALKPELVGDTFWRYQQNVSPGLQEYIEALSFAHYLDTGALITFDDVQSSLSDNDGPVYSPLSAEFDQD